MTVVKMPQLGETVIEGTILKWLKQEGDQVALDEPLFEISTDKVDTEVPSSAAGVLAKIMVAEGETVAVGTELAEIADGGAGGAASSGSCGAARFGRLLGSRDLVCNRRWRRCSLRSGTTRCCAGSSTGRRAGCRFYSDGAAPPADRGPRQPDLVAARSEAGDGARHRPRAGGGDGDRGDGSRRTTCWGSWRLGGPGRRPPSRRRHPLPPRSPLRRVRPRRPRWRRSRRSPWGAARRSCRSRTSASRSRST